MTAMDLGSVGKHFSKGGGRSMKLGVYRILVTPAEAGVQLCASPSWPDSIRPSLQEEPAHDGPSGNMKVDSGFAGMTRRKSDRWGLVCSPNSGAWGNIALERHAVKDF